MVFQQQVPLDPRGVKHPAPSEPTATLDKVICMNRSTKHIRGDIAQPVQSRVTKISDMSKPGIVTVKFTVPLFTAGRAGFCVIFIMSIWADG